MKFFFGFLVAVMLASTVHAMNDDADESWREPLIYSCEAYQTYLPIQYTCVCTKYIHRFLNSATAKDEHRKTEQLSILINDLADKKLSSNQVRDFLEDKLAPYLDDYGKIFFRSAMSLLSGHVDKRSRCAICLSAHPEVLLLPCSHHTTCEECTAEIRGGKDNFPCPICKTTVVATRKLTNTNYQLCQKCKLVPPEVLYDCCGKFCYCAECDKDEACLDCGADAVIKIIVFAN